MTSADDAELDAILQKYGIAFKERLGYPSVRNALIDELLQWRQAYADARCVEAIEKLRYHLGGMLSPDAQHEIDYTILELKRNQNGGEK